MRKLIYAMVLINVLNKDKSKLSRLYLGYGYADHIVYNLTTVSHRVGDNNLFSHELFSR